MPYLTPDEIPEGTDCRPLFIPASSDWLAIVSGAITELSLRWNWEQQGSVTVDEAVARMDEMIQTFYEALCCSLPGGEAILRLDDTGHIQQLINGAWEEPTGDYSIPPVPSREEPTIAERKCAAAANAANVLAQLYEEVSDAVGAGASEAEALAILVGAATTIIGSWLGFAVAPLVALALAAFKAFLEIAEFMTADLWDEQFTDLVKCRLLNCANDEGDVITFDFNCFRESLAQYTDILDPNFVNNIRLFGQLDFILNVIGADGLNAAGATTAVEGDCTDCGDWCVTIDLADDDGGLTNICSLFPSATCGCVYTPGVGWTNGLGATGSGVTRFSIMQLDFTACFIRRVVLVADPYGMGAGDFVHVRLTAPDVSGAPTSFVNGSAGSPDPVGVELVLDDTCDRLRLTGGSTPAGATPATGSAALRTISIYGSGEKPADFETWVACPPA